MNKYDCGKTDQSLTMSLPFVTSGLFMLTILNLFGRSPFAPLLLHMEMVTECVHGLKDLFQAVRSQEDITEICKKISKIEHKADLAKNDIRNHLPNSLYLPIARADLLEILTLQDQLADLAEDVAILTTMKQIKIPKSFENEFNAFLEKNLECFDGVVAIIGEMNDLLGSSFGGVEAEKVRSMVDEVAFKEHEVDLIQRKLNKQLFSDEEEMEYKTFVLWLKIIQTISSLSNVSEKLAHRIRMTLDVK